MLTISFGEIDSVAVPTFSFDGQSKGYAFIIFASEISVDLVQQTRPHVMDERMLVTERARPRHLLGSTKSKVTTTKLFIGPPRKIEKVHCGLSENISDRDLAQHFSKFGRIVKTHQFRWRDSGKKKGCGIIEFTDSDSVDKAVLIQKHFVKGIELEAKKALTKSQMNECERLENERDNFDEQDLLQDIEMFIKSKEKDSADDDIDVETSGADYEEEMENIGDIKRKMAANGVNDMEIEYFEQIYGSMLGDGRRQQIGRKRPAQFLYEKNTMMSNEPARNKRPCNEEYFHEEESLIKSNKEKANNEEKDVNNQDIINTALLNKTIADLNSGISRIIMEAISTKLQLFASRPRSNMERNLSTMNIRKGKETSQKIKQEEEEIF